MNSPSLKVGDVVCRIDPTYFRPGEVETLLGDPTKAKNILGWEPLITAREMCAEIVASNLFAAKRGVLLKSREDDPAIGVK
ncbi:GDP-mannose 4,6-dehydratase [Porticoccaceae bacterium]|nr:GDP-mannose 4,6-dehydratase [Porticoccaceae bacterium]